MFDDDRVRDSYNKKGEEVRQLAALLEMLEQPYAPPPKRQPSEAELTQLYLRRNPRPVLIKYQDRVDWAMVVLAALIGAVVGGFFVLVSVMGF